MRLKMWRKTWSWIFMIALVALVLSSFVFDALHWYDWRTWTAGWEAALL